MERQIGDFDGIWKKNHTFRRRSNCNPNWTKLNSAKDTRLGVHLNEIPEAWEGGGCFLKTPFLLRYLAYLANFVLPILILPWQYGDESSAQQAKGQFAYYRRDFLDE